MKLAILIPYYKNSEECEIQFKKLMKTLETQIGGNIDLFIYEDGQTSEWLYNYENDNIDITSSCVNSGVAYTRNCLLLLVGNDYGYIMFLDSDDMIDCDFIRKMYTEASTGNYDMIVSRLIMNKKELITPVRSNVAGICLRTKFIERLSFDTDYNISEDTIFINEVYKRNPRIGTIDSNYYYNYGSNPNSLMMRYERSEIGLKYERKDKEKI